MRSILLLLSLTALCTATELNTNGLRQLEQQNCGVVKESSAIIIGEDEVIPGSRPWMALINTNESSKNYVCLGTLITDQFVLTAGHCLYGSKIESVRLGEHQLTSYKDCIEAEKTQCYPNIESFGIESVIIHDKFTMPSELSSYSYDIALLKLNRKVDFKDHISPICLPVNATLEQQATSLETLLLTAWRKDTPGILNKFLREITVDNRVENRQTCAEKISPISENLICVFKKPNILCNGISGSPLSSQVEYNGTKRFVQFAVSNLGLGCNTLTGINIARFMPWITNVLAKES